MTKREWQLAIPILISLACCAAAFLHGHRLADPRDGTTAMRAFSTTAQGGHVAVVASGALHVLDARGHRVARQDLKTLGLTESPNDMDWTVDDQQHVEAWLFDDATVPRVVRCDWSFERTQLVDCRTAMEGPQLKASARSRTMHLAVDRGGQRVFIADANSDRIQIYDLGGKPLASTDPQAVPLYFPNRLRYLGDNTLVVADNDHRRLAWVSVPSGQPAQLGRTLRSADHGQARAGRSKVTDGAFGPDGTVWMLAMKQGQRDGDVLVFDAQHRPVARAALEDGADPLVVEALGDNTALVADFGLTKLHHVDAQGRKLGEFGDEAFRGELKTVQDRVQAGRWWKKGAMVIGGVVIALGLVLGLLFGQKPKQRGEFDNAAKAALADLAGETSSLRFPLVLQQTDAYQAEIRKQLMWLGIAALAGIGFLAFVAVPMAQSINPGKAFAQWKFAAPLLLIAAIACASLLLAWRDLVRPGELRISQNKLAWFHGEEMVCVAPLAEASASTNTLLLGHKPIRLRVATLRPQHGTARFDMDLFNRAVLARLPQDRLVSDQALAWQALKSRPLWQKGLLCAMVVVGILINFYSVLR